jgi:TolB-like protein
VTDPNKAVFLSYASQDAEAAQNLCNALRAAGFEVWFDQSELRGGDAWDASIRRQIKSCALFIPVISRNTHSRGEGYFRLEWKLAVDRSHLMASDLPFLLPVVVDDTPDQEDRVPDRFREVQWTRLPAGANTDAFVAHVRRLLSPDATVVTAPSVGSSAPPVSSTVAATTRSMPPASRLLVPWIVGGLLILAAGYIVTNRFMASKHTVPTTQTPAMASVPEASDKSIAVLPFADMSEKKDQEYFSDGLSEDLIDLLTKVPELHVPARASSFYFKGQHATIREIAKALAVAYVLEGSVRKSGNTVRVRTELIRADNGYNLWSETYDRDLKDIFKVQDEIAGRVVAALKGALPGALKPVNADQRTDNPEAYNQYLLGEHFFDQFDEAAMRRSLNAFKKSIALDPQYAAAYAGLAFAEAGLADNIGDPAGVARAMAAAERAIALAPEDAAGYGARGWLRTGKLWDWDGAAQDFAKVVSINANADLSVRAELARAQGRLAEAIALHRRAAQRDPLSPLQWTPLAELLIDAGDLEEARSATQRALEIEPAYSLAKVDLSRIEVLEGHPDQALATAQQIKDPVWRLLAVALAEHSLHHARESGQALDTLIRDSAGVAAYQIAEIYAFRGETDHAFAWLDRAYRQHDGGLYTLKTDWFFKSLRSDPRYAALVRRLKLPD